MPNSRRLKRLGKLSGKSQALLIEDLLPADGDVTAKAKEILSEGPAIVVADLEAKDLLGVADLPGAKQSIIFNIRLSDDQLRGAQCPLNIFHVGQGRA